MITQAEVVSLQHCKTIYTFKLSMYLKQDFCLTYILVKWNKVTGWANLTQVYLHIYFNLLDIGSLLHT